MEQLIQEAVVTVPRALIAETIDLVAVLSGSGASRRLAELARIEGLGPGGDYRVTPANQPLTGEPSCSSTLCASAATSPLRCRSALSRPRSRRRPPLLRTHSPVTNL